MMRIFLRGKSDWKILFKIKKSKRLKELDLDIAFIVSQGQTKFIGVL